MLHYFYFLSFLFVTGFISLSQIHAADRDRPFSATRASRSSPSPGEREIYTHHPEGRWNKEWLEGQKESPVPAISNNGLDYYLSNGREGIFRTIIDRLYGDFLVGLGHEESLPYDPLEFVLSNDREIAKKSEYATLLRGVNQYLWSGKYFKIAQMPEAFERPSSSHARCMATIIRAYEEPPGKETLAKLYEANTTTPKDSPLEDRVVLIAHLAVVATVHYEATRVYYPLADRIQPKGNIIWALDREENKVVLKSEPEAPLNLLDLVNKFEGWKEEINTAFLEAKSLLAREDAATSGPIRKRRNSFASPGESTVPRRSPRRLSVTASASGAAGISLTSVTTARGRLPAGGLLNFTDISGIAQRSGSRDSHSSIGGDDFGFTLGRGEEVDNKEGEEEQNADSSGKHRVTPEVRRSWLLSSAANNSGEENSKGDMGTPLVSSDGSRSSTPPPGGTGKYVSLRTPPRSGNLHKDAGQFMGNTTANGYAQLDSPSKDDKKSKKGKTPKKDAAATTEENSCCCVA
jgi:hypothetical protein